jgi:hypothetical protein
MGTGDIVAGYHLFFHNRMIFPLSLSRPLRAGQVPANPDVVSGLAVFKKNDFDLPLPTPTMYNIRYEATSPNHNSTPARIPTAPVA